MLLPQTFPHPILLTQLQSPGGTKGINCNETLQEANQPFWPPAVTAPHRPPAIPRDPSRQAGCCLPSSCTGRQGVGLAVLCLAHSPYGSHASAAQPPAIGLKDVRLQKAISYEKISTGSPDCFWPSQILLHSPWEQFVCWTDSSWCSCA